MSKLSNDPNKYYRTGIALPVRMKPAFEERIAALGLKTVGELVLMFTTAEGAVEALKPIADKFVTEREVIKSTPVKVKDVSHKLKGMTPEQLARVLAMIDTLPKE